MSSFTTKCAHCKQPSNTIHFHLNKNQSFNCGLCHNTTYYCDGTCETNYEYHLNSLKESASLTPKIKSQYYRTRLPYHKTPKLLQMHIQKYHTNNLQNQHWAYQTISNILDQPLHQVIDGTNNNIYSCDSDDDHQTLIYPDCYMSTHIALTRYVKSCLNVGLQESTKVLVCQAMYQKIYFNH